MVAGRVQSECSRPVDGVRAASRCLARYAVARRCTDHLNLLDDKRTNVANRVGLERPWPSVDAAAAIGSSSSACCVSSSIISAHPGIWEWAAPSACETLQTSEDPMVPAVRDRALEPEATWPIAGPNPSPAVSDLSGHGPRWMLQPPSVRRPRHAACPPPSYRPTLASDKTSHSVCAGFEGA